MKEFWLETILYPFVAILFCLAFGIPFVWAGFQTIQLQAHKDETGTVTVDFTRSHFFGLLTIEEHVEEVEGASRQSSLVRIRSGQFRRNKLVSGVFLNTDEGDHRLMAGSSNIDDDLKWEMVTTINDYVRSPDQTAISSTFEVRNIFGWFGLPFLALGALGLIGWPSSIIKALRE
ncbi:MAG: hypothetical protein JW757_09385 [Anaerolineales bacterium]|nr:hypothetical protein [Anaerolineales bacterium]